MASYDSERVFAERLANVFLQDHKVKVGEISRVIACCDVMKKQIWFDFPEIFPKNLDDEQEKIFQQMMVFKGLSFHEILHLKFTPKQNRRITNQLFLRLLGQLEDGRIETLGVMLHEKLADYFICSVDEIIIKDRNAIIENKDNWLIFAYILCYGRSIYFQDKDLLAMMREMIIKTYGRETAELIEDTINAFLPEISFEKRVEIAQKLFDHLNGKGIMPKFDMSKPMDVFIITGRGDENDKNIDKDLKKLSEDFPELAKALDGVAKQLKEMTKDVKDDSKGMEKAKQEKEDKIANIMKKRQEVYKKVYDEKDADKRNKLRQEVDELTDELKETQSSTGFSPNGLGDVKEKLKQKIDDKEEEQEKLVETHRDDLTADLKSIGHELQDVYADNTFTVTQEMRTMAKDLEKNLVKMNNELASGYQPKNKSGRLNVRSLLNRKNQMDFKIFNRYTPDKLRLTKALVNIYVDGSGSMSMEWDKAVSCMWVINEALNRDENKVMIYQFSSGYELIKEYEKPLTVPNMIGGGTYPAGAIEHSIKIIEGYKKAKNFNFVVDIIITDGEFDDGQDVSIMKLNNLGHETILIKVGAYAGNPELTHKSKHTLGLKGFGDLVGSLTKIFIEIKKGLVAKTRMI